MKIIISAIAIFLTFNCFGQIRTIVGKVLDSNNQAPVRYANVLVSGTPSGTTTNFSGYFQIELANGYEELVISHIGYETGKISIPDIDNFKILLKPGITKLKGLNLNQYASDNRNLKGHSILVENSELTTVEEDAEYIHGWEYFYAEFGNRISNDSSFISDDFYALLKFTITKNGDIEKINIDPDNTLNKDLIIESLMKMTSWKPANQNKVPTKQSFHLPIFTSKEIFTIVENPPQPHGGMHEFYKYVGKNLKYPVQARRMGIEGKVYVQFMINGDGTITDVEVVKGIGAGCDTEVLRVVSHSPSWIPGTQKGLPVRVKMILPITFSLGGHKNFKNDGTINQDNLMSEVSVVALGINRFKENQRTRPSFFDMNKNPEFPGGSEKLLKYIKTNKRNINQPIPPNKLDNNVYLKVTVDIQGNMKNVQVIKGLARTFDEEAVRIFSNMPRWIPAISNGQPIEKTITTTVYFGIISESKLNSANNNFMKGISFYKKGKLENALVQFTKAIEKNSTQADYYFNRAATLLEMSNPGEACRDLEMIKHLDQEALYFYNKNCKVIEQD